MKKNLQKTSIIVLLLIVSLPLGFYIHFYLADFILDLHRWATDNAIKFIGKSIILPSVAYLICFTIAFTFLGYQIIFIKTNRLKQVIIWLFIFGLSILILSSINAKLLIMNCTACDDGILKIRYHNADYNAILTISSLLSMIPSLVRLLKIKREVKS